MKKARLELTEKQKAQLAALESLPDAQVDTSDIPETLDWSGGMRGAFYRPVLREITLKLDENVIDWFKANAPDGQDYQKDINRVLVEHVWQTRRKSLTAAREAEEEGA